MGANLVPIVRNFAIQTKTFTPQDCAVQEGCAVPGSRKLLRFDFLCWNAGNRNAHLGSPSQNPQWYVFSNCHGHYHLRNFNDYKLYDCRGRVRTGLKQAFCLMDVERRGGTSPRLYTCSDQGVSAGWADVYGAGLDCQWIDITGLVDGEYVLEARTNQSGIVREDSYGDNFTWAGVRIAGSRVTEIPAPCYPEDCVGFNPASVQAKNVGGAWKVVDGAHWMLDFGTNRINAQRARDVIRHYSFDSMCFVGRPSPNRRQLMMYFKVGARAPRGPLRGEDAISFNPSNVSARKIGGSWKVMEGQMSMLDFGVSEANARKAVWIIQHYGFRYQCFVGRPNAPMMYFRC